MRANEKPIEMMTFDEMVGVLALNAPHALVLDWWRRLERAIDYYFNARGLPRPRAVEAERAIKLDPTLGAAIAAEVRALRCARNVVAHEESRPIELEEAATYAARCLDLIWQIATDPGEAGVQRMVRSTAPS